jgi:hypothetical protein
MRHQQWQYITKFGTPTTGGVNVDMRARFVAPYRRTDEEVTLQVAFYVDNAFLTIVEDQGLSCAEKERNSFTGESIQLPTNGEWGKKYRHKFYNAHIPKTYFFVVLDCARELHSSDKVMPKIEVDFEITNEPYSGVFDHFSYED